MIQRIYHPWTAWESVSGGLYENSPPNPLSPDEAMRAYAEFLADNARFRSALERVALEWPRSCEHFLTNESLNRVAWLGQASMCIATRVPRRFRGGFCLLSDADQRRANAEAKRALREWIRSRVETSTAFTLSESGEGSDATDLLAAPRGSGTRSRVQCYQNFWLRRGYPLGIPDEVPAGIMEFAPSYRAIGEALLRNDFALNSLGFRATPSLWYGALKRIEIDARPRSPSMQMDLFA